MVSKAESQAFIRNPDKYFWHGERSDIFDPEKGR